MTAERISATKAQTLGLVHEVTTVDALDEKVEQMVQALLLGGPEAQAASKHLIQLVEQHPLDNQLLLQTAQHIAQLRQGAEAKDGLTAFLNKQAPAWIMSAAEQQ